MTTKLTNRDKKLLVFLAVFLLVVGLGGGVILPLLEKNRSVGEKAAEAQLVKLERERKVAAVASAEKAKEKEKERYSEIKKEFSDVVPSREIDKMLTEEALARGVTITNMSISMPETESDTVLTDYSEMLEERLQGVKKETGEEEETAFAGLGTAKADLTMSGSRTALQQVLDSYAAAEPKIRIADFLWESGREEHSGKYTLSIRLEIYMMEDVK